MVASYRQSGTTVIHKSSLKYHRFLSPESEAVGPSCGKKTAVLPVVKYIHFGENLQSTCAMLCQSVVL